MTDWRAILTNAGFDPRPGAARESPRPRAAWWTALFFACWGILAGASVVGIDWATGCDWAVCGMGPACMLGVPVYNRLTRTKPE